MMVVVVDDGPIRYHVVLAEFYFGQPPVRDCFYWLNIPVPTIYLYKDILQVVRFQFSTS